MNEAFTFDDVLIIPRFSTVQSRKDVDLSTKLKHLNFKLPVISANMDTVTNEVMAKAMLYNGAQACIHRFGSIEDTVNMFVKSSDENYSPMVSVGIGDVELERAKALFNKGAHTLIIDVAHGSQLSVVNQVKALREIVKDNAAIIVGNFAGSFSVQEFIIALDKTTVEGIKVGIGPGSACTTRIKTGVGYPQLSAVKDIAQLLKYTGISVIADGGMKTPGDVAKAIGAGAHMVMLGGFLAGTEESPGEITYFTKNGPTTKEDLFAKKVKADGTYDFIIHSADESFYEIKKKYRGSASKESYQAQGKDTKYRTDEGESFLVPYKGPVANILQDIEGGLRSAFTYVGASNIKEFHEKVDFVRISGATIVENRAHGK